MAIYDGVVTLAEDDVPVIVELDHERVRLSASGTEIGAWDTKDCQIRHVGEAKYSITAEDETIEFVPNQPGLFAAALNGYEVTQVTSPARHEQTTPPAEGPGTAEVPPPKPVTLALFYALCVITAGLALWSLVSLLLG
ncbi:MAG: hypothetical protein ACRDU9_11090 [Acidimicrobiia bacterium]